MSVGSFVIANDLLGVIVAEGQDGKNVTIKDKENKIHIIKRSVCHEIVAPHALALLLYNKVLKQTGKQPLA